MPKKALFLLLIIIANILCEARRLPDNLTDAIDSLEYHIKRRDIYINNRRASIETINKEMDAMYSRDPALKYEALGNAFHGFKVDSALYYYNKGVEAAAANKHSHLEWRLKMRRDEVLTLLGLFKEAIDDYESCDISALEPSDHIYYYRTGSDIYLHAYNYYPEPYKDMYRRKAIVCLDSTLRYYPAGSVAIDLTNAQIKILEGENALSLADLQQALPNIDITRPEFAITTSLMADFYKRLPSRHNEYLYYLALSATSDLLTATCETTSLKQLGMEYYAMGDIERAYRYLSIAQDNDLFANARIRSFDTTKEFTKISNEIRDDSHRTNTTLVIIIIVLLIGLALCLFLIFLKSIRHRRAQLQSSSLIQSNMHKDNYIRQLLSLCYVYIESLEDLNRLAARKLKAGQAQDLYQIVDSGKVLRDRAEQFYKTFDEAFFNIYPSFIDDINGLLLPDKQVSLPDANVLTPEIRVIAFMRLGIDDSSKIAKFLDLSLNTVYTYRNRMKARAKSRDTFEADIMKIGHF